MDQEFDLWGDPIPPPTERRGRPAHEVTAERKLRVAVLRALNQSNDEIAAAMGISERTLRTHYSVELKQGLAQKRAEVMVLLWDQAKKGNVSAMKEFLRQTERSDLAGAPRLVKVAQEPKLGKKAQAVVDAQAPDPTESMGELMMRRAETLRVIN